MRALVFTRPGVVELLDGLPEPTAAADEVIVEVHAAGICGSELHGIHQVGFRTPPLVMGHEFAGRTPHGRRVVVQPVLSCGSCDVCRTGATQLCRTRSVVGIHRPGGFAERAAVPAALLHDLPNDVTWDAAAMVEPLANAVAAWRLVAERSPRRVGIVGSGTIGLVSALVALDAGADVEVCDLSENRLTVAAGVGARTTRGTLSGEYDAVIDAVGLGATRRTSVEALRPGGAAIWLGLGSPEVDFDGQALVRTGKSIHGSFAYDVDAFEEALRRVRDFDWSWATPVPFGDAEQTFMSLAHGKSPLVKAVVHPQES